jgi:hypothetical protein
MGLKDVFICHRGPDTKRQFSSWLAAELDRRMFPSFLDQLSLQPGNPSLEAIAAALRDAKVVIVVLSAQFFSSHHCVRELRQSRNLGKKVIPLFFDLSPDQCRPESILQETADIDWSQFDGGRSGWEEDVRWIKGITGRQLKEVDGFWGRYIDVTIQDVAKELGRPVADLQPNLVPNHRNAAFVGREKQLEDLRGIMEREGRAYVSGMGGIGKTQVLLEYVYRHRADYAKILWVNAGSQSRVASFLTLALYLGVELEKEGADVEGENIGRVRGALETVDTPYLLVMDNVDEESGFWDLLPRHGLCQVRL